MKNHLVNSILFSVYVVLISIIFSSCNSSEDKLENSNNFILAPSEKIITQTFDLEGKNYEKRFINLENSNEQKIIRALPIEVEKKLAEIQGSKESVTSVTTDANGNDRIKIYKTHFAFEKANKTKLQNKYSSFRQANHSSSIGKITLVHTKGYSYSLYDSQDRRTLGNSNDDVSKVILTNEAPNSQTAVALYEHENYKGKELRFQLLKGNANKTYNLGNYYFVPSHLGHIVYWNKVVSSLIFRAKVFN